MKILPILLVMCASSAFAGKPAPPPPTTAMAQAEQVQSQGQSQGQGQDQSQDQSLIGGDNFATGGEGGKGGKGGAGGQAVAGGGEGGKSSAILNNVTPDKIRIQNNAPVVLGAPDVSGGICIVSFSGAVSGKQGAIAIFPYRRDPACFAERRFERLAALGLFIPASKAYCDTTWRGGFLWLGQRGYWTDFGSIEDCEIQMLAGLKAMAAVKSIVVTIDFDEAEQTCTTTGENVFIREIGDDGEMASYECRELKGKMGG